jgi:hypothetical protein
MQNDQFSGQPMLDIVRSVCTAAYEDASELGNPSVSRTNSMPDLDLLRDIAEKDFDSAGVLERFTADAHRD